MYLQLLVNKKKMAVLWISLYQQALFADEQNEIDLVGKINLSAY